MAERELVLRALLMGQPSKHCSAGTTGRRWTSYTGFFFDEFAPDSVWIRETAVVRLPPLEATKQLRVRGTICPHPDAHGLESTIPNLTGAIGDQSQTAVVSSDHTWEILLDVSPPVAKSGPELRLTLHGVTFTNFLAWLGRVTGAARWQRFRRQNKNRQVRVIRIETGEGEIIYDFSHRQSPYSVAFARRHMHLGLNIAGFLTADLGVGESARCMARAADAARLPAALVPLKLHCKNRLGDLTYADRLQETNPHDVNVIHLDPPSSRDLTHHHGPAFLAGKYNIAYWAWELPEFPDAWVPCIDYYDEIWCPSDFTREAIAMKSSVPVITMPHAISFPRPQGTFRPRFALPPDKFLFLFVYDLNSYSERKNPQAVIDAFRHSGLSREGAELVVKVQNAAGNEADLLSLQRALADLPGTILISETLSREEIYQLESACDCFISLHRAEGFGLAVAECMYLGKPVIATNWSATSEYLNASNGCPVDFRVATLEKNHGPYMKGSYWAEPDVAHAAWWMQQVLRDRALAKRLGTAAQATIEARFGAATIGARYRTRLESIAWF